MMERNKIPAAAASALLMIFLFFLLHMWGYNAPHDKKTISVGFICEGDESTPYSENFLRVLDVLEMEYSDRLDICIETNTPADKISTVIDTMADKGCEIIFTNTYGCTEELKTAAVKHPGIEFCQAGCGDGSMNDVCRNYHTFTGEIYEGWYCAGKVAGLKLNELIDENLISKDESILGFVAKEQDPETISAFTAFVLGARSECPTAMLHVRSTHTWDDYYNDMKVADELLDEGCIILSQNTDTSGVAAACENAKLDHPVFHVAYNLDMLKIAPNTSLTGVRVDWSPYICSAVEAVLEEKRIEDNLDAHIHGNDAGAGFSEGWVKMLDLNRSIAPTNSTKVISDTMKDIQSGNVHIFSGDYIGYNPNDRRDTIDLQDEYIECRDSSVPSFHYILNGIVKVEWP